MDCFENIKNENERTLHEAEKKNNKWSTLGAENDNSLLINVKRKTKMNEKIHLFNGIWYL